MVALAYTKFYAPWASGETYKYLWVGQDSSGLWTIKNSRVTMVEQADGSYVWTTNAPILFPGWANTGTYSVAEIQKYFSWWKASELRQNPGPLPGVTGFSFGIGSEPSFDILDILTVTVNPALATTYAQAIQIADSQNAKMQRTEIATAAVSVAAFVGGAELAGAAGSGAGAATSGATSGAAASTPGWETAIVQGAKQYGTEALSGAASIAKAVGKSAANSAISGELSKLLPQPQTAAPATASAQTPATVAIAAKPVTVPVGAAGWAANIQTMIGGLFSTIAIDLGI